MCIRTFSRCIILPAKYALKTKCCHWRQHGRPAGFLASFSGPSWDLSRWTCLFGKHSLTMLRAWAGPFKCLFWASARRCVPPAVKCWRAREQQPTRTRAETALAADDRSTQRCWPLSWPGSFSQVQPRLRVFLEERNGSIWSREVLHADMWTLKERTPCAVLIQYDPSRI